MNTSSNATAHESTEIPAQFLEALPDPLIVFDASRKIVFVNAAGLAWLNSLGCAEVRSCDEFLARVTIYEKSKPMSDERNPVLRALRGETAVRSEYRIARPGRAGTTWIEWAASPAAGGALVSIRDITARKKAELAAESEARLRDVIDQGNLTGIIQTGVDGQVIHCNDAMARFLGYSSKQEVLGIRAQQFYFDPRDRDVLLRQIMSKGKLTDYEVCFRRRDHSRCWGLVNVRYLQPEKGEAGATLVATVIDITERKLWEEMLRQTQERFNAFMTHLPGVAFLKDPDGRYVYHNEACRSLFNLQPEEIAGKTDDALWPPEDAAVYRESDALVLRTGQPIEVVERVAHPDGPHTWLLHKFPVKEGGQVVLVGGIGIDITDRHSLEEQLKQSRRVEALGRLASGVAHDFNNALTVISGYGQLALEGIGATSSERLTLYLKEILASARRAAGLTGKLLAFGRRQTVQPKIHDLAEIVQNLEHLLRPIIGEHVELIVRGDRGCLVLVDAPSLEQVLMNLSVNARDAMPLGGTLEISCRLLHPPREREGRQPLGVLLEVRDNGIGMDAEVRSKLFEPFFTSKDQAKGTGLGLSASHDIVTGAGGEIEAESEQGEGSVFRIYLPLASGEVEPVRPVRPQVKTSGLETVLLVEDEGSVRLLAETILGRFGYKVLVAESGKAALEIWKEFPGSIDLLLTDVIMPHMSGSELAHKLRKLKPGLKILFMSGYTDDMLVSHGVLTGDTQLILKPFTAEDLGRKVRSILGAPASA